MRDRARDRVKNVTLSATQGCTNPSARASVRLDASVKGPAAWSAAAHASGGHTRRLFGGGGGAILASRCLLLGWTGFGWGFERTRVASCSLQDAVFRIFHSSQAQTGGVTSGSCVRAAHVDQFAVCSLQFAARGVGGRSVCSLQFADCRFREELYARKYAVCRLQIAGCKGSASAKALLRELADISRTWSELRISLRAQSELNSS